jgi:hypothetical protein
MESVLTPPPPARKLPQPGQLTLAYRWIVVVFWMAIVVGLGTVVGASEVVGRQVWWLGDDGRRAPIFVLVLPVIAPMITMVAAVNNRRWVPYASCAAALTTLLTAWGDRNRSPGAALVELALGVAAALLSAATFAGRYRAAGERRRDSVRGDPGAPLAG